MMPPGPSDPLTPRVIDGLYTEAMLLTDEARAYFDGAGRGDRQSLIPELQVVFACESLKVTTRLMHVAAWLVARRSRENVVPLGHAPRSDAGILAGLPEQARSIVAASTELHARIRRIDGAAETIAISPARGLQSRLERVF